MPDVTERKLTDLPRTTPHLAFSLQVDGGLAVGMGLLFVVGGVALVCGPMRSDGGQVHPSIGLIALLFGLAVTAGGFRDVAESRRRDRLLAENPGASCLSDYPWDPRGTADETGKLMLRLVRWLLIPGLIILVPWNRWAFGSEGLLRKVLPVLLDLAWVVVLAALVYLMVRKAKHGSTKLLFRRFPFALGDRLDVSLVSDTLAKAGRFSATLRCVEERIEGQGKSREVVCYQIYGDLQEIDLATLFPQVWGLLPISFPLPRGDYSTCLRMTPGRFWEIEIDAETPGVNFGAVFLVPIYDEKAQ